MANCRTPYQTGESGEPRANAYNRSHVCQFVRRKPNHRIRDSDHTRPDWSHSRLDWLGQQDHLEWDLTNDRVRVGSTQWLPTHSEEQEVRPRLIILANDAVIPPRGQAVVKVHMPYNRWHREEPHEEFGVLESETPIPHLPHLYVGRTLVSMRTTDLEILILNAQTHEERSAQGSCLGKVYEAGSIRPPHVNRIHEDETNEVSDVVEQMMQELHDDLNNEQRGKVRT